MTPPGLSITAAEWEIVRQILEQYVPGQEVWAFGSRVRGTAKPLADLDLAILSDVPLPSRIHADLVDAFTESDVPWRVDLVDWAATTPEFRRIIQQHKVVVKAKVDSNAAESTAY